MLTCYASALATPSAYVLYHVMAGMSSAVSIDILYKKINVNMCTVPKYSSEKEKY